ncbi:MAG: Asp-tRNAAsn/Glu-tRNAGln amidotransferase A subunit [Chloroflexi bacterium]|nr:MAG: Asp-tRNAAsn/Glu-tRNAGln amidotransferase A subunit [Chloroflexota bacterium]
MVSLAHSLPLAPTLADLRDGGLDLAGHVDAALERLESLEPRLRAFVPEAGRAERVRAAARALADSASRPPLFGALVGVKDIFAIDGLPMRAGSALPAEAFAMPESAAVRRLLEAGALVLGKTVTTEFAFMEAGATANPHDQTRTPGGSSSGSAAAVAAGIVPLALGSQTVGSVLRPAAFCGVVGFKPTYGRIPIDGVIPYSPSVDTVGTFTQDVAGAALVAAVLIDDWAPPQPGPRPVLGVPDGRYLEQTQPDGRAAFEGALARLAQAGFEIVRVDALPDVEAINARHNALNAAEFAMVHRDWFAQWGALYRGGSAALFDRGRVVSAELVRVGREGRGRLREELTRLMDVGGIDAWVAPAAPGPAPLGLDTTGVTAMNLPWTHAGLPAIALPAGSVDGMPVGVQAAARFGEDERLLVWAERLEVPLRG